MGNTPVRNAAWWTHSIRFSGSIRPRMLAEYSTMMCGMSSPSLRISQGTLDFPGCRLGHPNQRGLPRVFEARGDGRHTHRGDRMPSGVLDYDADARDLLDHVALGEGVLADSRLLDLAPDARRTHGFEPGKTVGVNLQSLLDLAIRQRSEQGETAGSDAQGSPAADLHRQRLDRITPAHAVCADGFGTASHREEGGVAGDFGELLDHRPGDAGELEALPGGPAKIDELGTEVEGLRLARRLDQPFIAQSGQDARGGGFAQPYSPRNVGESQLRCAGRRQGLEDSDATFQALHLVLPSDLRRFAGKGLSQ